MKGIKDITDGPRTYKEAIDDYVRLTLKRAIPSDEGTYCILVKNRYGCDRSFFSIWVGKSCARFDRMKLCNGIGNERNDVS